MRDALRIFRLTIIVELALVVLPSLAVSGLGDVYRWAVLMRTLPILLLAVLFLPLWLERALGRYFLALGLALQIFFTSMEATFLYFRLSAAWLLGLGLPEPVIELLSISPPIEPFFFLLIPLVLAAWAYGQKGALLGSTLAAGLHLFSSIWLASPSDRPVSLLAPAVARISILYVVPLIVSVLAERQRQQHAQLEVAHQRLRRHAATVEQLATSRERNRLARDLHDTLAHSLAALTVQLEALRTLLAHDPASAKQAVDEISAMARRGLDESRQAIQALRTDPVESMGLSGALRERLRDLQSRTGVLADLRVAGQARDLTAEESSILYRIADEALSNVEQHAGAKRVTVSLAYGVDQVDLVVRDDGRGFDPSSVDPKRFGLAGMEERAAMIGATLSARSTINGGTEIRCFLAR